jgi:integrase
LAIENGTLNTAPRIQKLSEVGNARQGFFGAMEFRGVLSNLPEHLADFCLYAYLTGWRAGEVRSLSWADLDGDTLKLRAENSKNRTARTVPLVGELAELIERRRAQMSPKTGLIFHHDGQRIGDFRRAWATACKLAACPGRLVHDLRRTAVRDMVRAGTPQSVAMSISGHKTNAMFLRYNITSDADQRQALLNRQSYSALQITVEPDKKKTPRPGTGVQ